MPLTFNEIHTISNTKGGVTSATPTSERLKKIERRCSEFTMKIFESSPRAKITHIFPAPIGDVLLQRSADFSSILHILNQIFRNSHSLKTNPQFCPRFGVKIIRSLRSPNGHNLTCPVHPAEYRRRFSPWSVFFNADKQAQDHHARDLRDSPKSFSIRIYFTNPTISPRGRPRNWCR
jgi:hypothetical protein